MAAARQPRDRQGSKTGRTWWGLPSWRLAARPSDCLLAASTASASLPVIGKHLKPLGGATAMGLWGAQHLPRALANMATSRLTPAGDALRRRERDQTRAVVEAALRGVVPDAELDIDWPPPEPTPPAWKALHHRRHCYRSAVRYGSEPTQVLDVWRRKDLPAGPAPVMIFVPGGAWVQGSRTLQGYAMLSRLAETGWVCLSIDYRTAPHHRWPRHLIDVKTAIAWARANVDKYGGDRNFVAIAGASAGGHLAALAGLTGGDTELAEQLPDGADTAVDAVIGVYGRYDWHDRSTTERLRFVDFLERVVVGERLDRRPELYRKASPIARVHPGAPPFFVIHGSNDTVIPVAQARAFVERLRRVSQSAVAYLELPGAGHAFDLTDGARTPIAATAVGLFLDQVHRSHRSAGAKRVI